MPLPDFFEPERLRAFMAVAETGSFSKAANRLRLAQPTVSIQVRRLEEMVGQVLIDRATPGAGLTEAGEVFLGYAKELLGIVERARHHFAQPPLDGAVRLGVVEDFNFAAFAEILGGLVERHRCFKLSIRIETISALYAQLRRDELDIVLVKREVGSTEGDFICRQEMTWVGHQAALQDCDDVVPLVLPPPHTMTRVAILRALQAAGRRWSVRLEAPTLASLQPAVQAGLGVTALGVGMIPPGLDRFAAHLLPPLEPVEFTLAVNPRSKDPVVAAFATVLRRFVPMIVARLAEEQGQIS